ncbi:MAG: arsenate reductase ArsC [Acidobacteriota bacterium]
MASSDDSGRSDAKEAWLFLCVANSARSQLAEAVARELDPEREIWSAGSAPTQVRPEALTVLEEAGLPTDGLRSKGLGDVPMERVAMAVTLCAEESCPVLPAGLEHRHWPLPDPAVAPEAERLDAFRTTLAELRRGLPDVLSS